MQWQIQGGAGGMGHPLFLDKTEARKAFGRPPLPHPPYLKVWIGHWYGCVKQIFGVFWTVIIGVWAAFYEVLAFFYFTKNEGWKNCNLLAKIMG